MAQNVVEYVMKIKTKAAEQGLDSLTEELEQLIKELTKADKKGKKSFDETRKSTKKTKEKLKETEKQTNKTTKALTAVGRARSVWGKVQFAVAGVTTALTLSVVAAFKITQKVTDLTNELNDLAVRSGLTAQSIQGLRQALLASGQPATELNAILSGVATRFATFATEGGAVEKNFKSMGIAILDANGKLRSNNEIMLDGIKKLQSIGDASERSRVAVLLFGKAGSKLNQALAAGNFENFLEFTEKFGIDTGPKASKAAAEFQVSLSSLQTVVNGSLQRLVALFDGQDKVTKGMIKLGSTIVFTTALIEGLDKSYKDLNKTFTTSLEVSLDLMVASLMGPVFMSLSLVTKAAAFLGFEIDNLSNSLKRLVGLGLEKTIDPTNSLTSAFDNAIAEMKKYEELVESFGGSMNGLADATGEASRQMKKLGKESKKAVKDIRDLNDIVNDLLGRFIKLNIIKLLGDFNTIFFELEHQLFKLRGNLQSILNPHNLRTTEQWMSFLSDPIKRAEYEAQVSQDRLKKLFSKGLLGAITKTQDLFANNFFRDLESKFQNVLKAGSEKGLAGAFQALSTGGKIASVFGAAIFGAIKIAEGLGQRGSTVGEIEKSVEEDIRSRSKVIELGLQALPKILFDVLPPILREATDRIIFGMIKGFATTVREIFDIIRSLFTKEGRQEMTKSIKEGFKASLEEFWRRISVVGGILSKRGGGPYIPSARGGIKFTGADEGLAMLHRGEFVVPETGQMPQAVQRTMGMGQSGINITINAAVVESNAVDELVRQIERRFQTFGSSTSPLFGGR